jgi:hypothetical protein
VISYEPEGILKGIPAGYWDQSISRQSWMMEYIMQRALHEDMAVVATYATTAGPKEFCGFITKVNSFEKWLEIVDGDDRKIIRFKDLLRLEEAQEDV